MAGAMTLWNEITQAACRLFRYSSCLRNLAGPCLLAVNAIIATTDPEDPGSGIVGNATWYTC